jgi:hypothetical protein
MPFTLPKLSLSALLITSSLILLPSIAQAVDSAPVVTNYQSNTGTTRVLLSSLGPAQSNKWIMDYQTKINGETWSGSAQFTRVLGQNGNRALYGTFKDYAGDNGRPPNNGTSERSCTGDLTASQTAPNDRYQLKVTWKVTGGERCSSVGKTFSLDLAESLPSADAKGNFQFQNASVWTGLGPNQSDMSTWERWQVVDDGLNCRTRPNGAIVRTYRRGEQFAPLYEGRGGNPTAFLGSENTEATPDQVRQFKGDPWIRTRAKCYVRSNSQYIQPLSFSQPFKP